MDVQQLPLPRSNSSLWGPTQPSRPALTGSGTWTVLFPTSKPSLPTQHCYPFEPVISARSSGAQCPNHCAECTHTKEKGGLIWEDKQISKPTEMEAWLWAKHASNELQMHSSCSETASTKASELWRIASARHSGSWRGCQCPSPALQCPSFTCLICGAGGGKHPVLYSPDWPWTPNLPSTFQELEAQDRQTGLPGALVPRGNLLLYLVTCFLFFLQWSSLSVSRGGNSRCGLCFPLSQEERIWRNNFDCLL